LSRTRFLMSQTEALSVVVPSDQGPAVLTVTAPTGNALLVQTVVVARFARLPEGPREPYGGCSGASSGWSSPLGHVRRGALLTPVTASGAARSTSPGQQG
jgi:hypothetical protein